MTTSANHGMDSTDFAYQVTVYFPDGNEEAFRFTSSTVYVGRDTQSDLRLPYPRIAERHLMIQVARKDFLVTDLGTSGESRFHGEELEPHLPYRVREGEMVQVGSVRIAIEGIIEGEISDAQEPLGPRGVVEPLAQEGEDYIPPRGFEIGEDLRSELDERLSSAPRRVGGAGSQSSSGRNPRDFRAWRAPSQSAEPPLAVDVPWPRVLQVIGLVLGLTSLLVLVVLALL